MRSKVLKEILDSTPKEVKLFVDKYTDLVLRINEILEEKGYTQAKLADRMGKRPSEIHRWLAGDHNFTLRSIIKLEMELGEPLLVIPPRKKEAKTKGKLASQPPAINYTLNEPDTPYNAEDEEEDPHKDAL